VSSLIRPIDRRSYSPPNHRLISHLEKSRNQPSSSSSHFRDDFVVVINVDIIYYDIVITDVIDLVIIIIAVTVVILCSFMAYFLIYIAPLTAVALV